MTRGPFMQLSKEFHQYRKLEQLVENKTSYQLEHAELHIFETHEVAEKISLKFDAPVLATMMQGKKIMQLNEGKSFNFLPSESLLLLPETPMLIDFPEASFQNPTRCLAMTISEEKIKEILQLINERFKSREENEWLMSRINFHFKHDYALQQVLQHILLIFTEDHPTKDLFLDFALKELLIRILQHEKKAQYEKGEQAIYSNNRVAFIMQYIQQHLDEPLDIKTLSQKVYMSESHFHRVFKNEVGISPIEYLIEKRISKARNLLQNPEIPIKEVYLACGFNNISYFNRQFKRKNHCSPKTFRNQFL
ncbi:helix-turn-helix domain-containing protein [Persicobacter diffluens]|uniref:HTH araC/xylS-type domain-containing protein n=1 Tax=Persicobacter diffluens TaxID=981 RepID=A0AAN5ALC1_9BACT|nr:hypothetical protein PEDI_12700 [Persicobacter diffluens]